jgi:hypothetical protein
MHNNDIEKTIEAFEEVVKSLWMKIIHKTNNQNLNQ